MGPIIGIAGGSGAGKTTLVRLLLQQMQPSQVTALAFDYYYRDQSHLQFEERMLVNYDHPDSLDHELFVEHLHKLRCGEAVEVPTYDFATHTRRLHTQTMSIGDIVLLDGILLLHFQAIRELVDFAVFIDIDADVRLERRVHRDVVERGRDAADVCRQFEATVNPMHNKFVLPSIVFADRVVRIDEPLDDVAKELANSFAPVAGGLT